MTIDRMIELLNVEHDCMLRQAHGDCDRDCGRCDLVQDDDELHEMYTDVIALLKEQDAEIRQLKLALDIAKDTCKGINVGK